MEMGLQTEDWGLGGGGILVWYGEGGDGGAVRMMDGTKNNNNPPPPHESRVHRCGPLVQMFTPCTLTQSPCLYLCAY